MKTIVKLILLGLLINSQYSYAQTNADKAKAAYFKAEEQFQAGNYQICIDKLNEAIQLLGKSNARIQYLMVKSYKGLENYKQVKIELGKYFSFKPDEDEWYKEMLQLSEEADLKIKQNQDAEALKTKQKQEADALSKKDDEAWVIANSLNTKSSLEDYLSKFPKGKKASEANNRLEKIYWDEAKKTNTVSAYDIFIKKFPNSSFKQTAIQKRDELALDAKMRQNPDAYLDIELRKKNSADPYVIWKLVSYGASANKEVKIVDDNDYEKRYTPIGRVGACYSGDDEIKYLTFMLENGANPNQLASKNRDDPKIECESWYVIPEYLKDAPTHTYFDEKSELKKIQLLIKYGLDVNIDNGVIIWHLTKNHSQSKGTNKGNINNYDIIEYLLQNNANPKLSENSRCFSESDDYSYTYTHKRNSAYKKAKEDGKSDLLILFDKYKKK